MSLPYDAASQYLASYKPSDWPAVLGIETSGPVTPIVADLSTVSSRADVILRIEEQKPWILVIEFQAGPEKKSPPGRRFALYSLLAEDQFDLPVWVEVVQLRRKANSPRLTGVLHRPLPNKTCYHEFYCSRPEMRCLQYRSPRSKRLISARVMYKYGVTRVWEQPLEKYLSAGLGTLPLAVLTDQATSKLAAVLERIKSRIQNEIIEQDQERFWVATGALMGLRYKFDDYNPLLEKIMDLRDSTFIKHYEQKGRIKGRIEKSRSLLLKIGTRRFGASSLAVQQTIQAIHDEDRLDELISRCDEVAGWDELFPAGD